MEIRDYWVALEFDVDAAAYLHEEERKREDEREKRDREFWIAMFGGKGSTDNNELTVEESTLEEAMAKSPLGSR